jgi:hypothetical protein
MSEPPRPDQCGSCGGRLVGHGARSVAVPEWTGGILDWRDCAVERFRCRSCGKTSENSGPVSAARSITLRRVVACFVAEGGAATAARLGVDAKTVSAWVRDWVWPRRLPQGMPALPFVRRSPKSSTLMVHDASTGAVVGVFHAGKEGWREVAEAARLDRIERVLLEFDIEAFEALADAGIRAAVHPATSQSFLSKALDDARASLECALVGEAVSACGWSAKTVGLLRTAALPRSRLKLDMWRDAILDGLETAGPLAPLNSLDARCGPLRMMAVCAVALAGKKDGVGVEEVVSTLVEAGMSDDGRAVPIV